MTDLPVYALVPDWPAWVVFAALFGAGVVSFIRTMDLVWHGRADPWEDGE